MQRALNRDVDLLEALQTVGGAERVLRVQGQQDQFRIGFHDRPGRMSHAFNTCGCAHSELVTAHASSESFFVSSAQSPPGEPAKQTGGRYRSDAHPSFVQGHELQKNQGSADYLRDIACSDPSQGFV